MSKIRIFLVDDHQLVRDGIKALLTSAEDITIEGEASSGADCFQRISGQPPDILILDISLPDTNGIEITRRVTDEFPETRVLILSMYTNEDFIFNAIKAGAKGYLPKNTSREELLDAIHAIHNGDEFFADSISRIMLRSYVRKAKEDEPAPAGGPIPLTSREIEILKLFAEGYINKEISDRLDISIRTVETHKNHIMKKLELKSTVELIKYAIRNKIVEI
ncbi:MAG TPA: response regulator transcription factor [Bacteroidales bacterium]|nr:response regulator transcription factor [Bacteroidales bacterium]HPS61610.1 response regulator transcription factor [Bacteroidales bacterium]